MVSLIDYILKEKKSDVLDEINPDLIDTSKNKKEDANKYTKDIKFNIWNCDNERQYWVEKPEDYQKIYYDFEDEKTNIKISFLLGFKDGEWKLWIGKPGVVSYDDQFAHNLNTDKFSYAVTTSIQYINDFIEEVKKNKQKWIKFYV